MSRRVSKRRKTNHPQADRTGISKQAVDDSQSAANSIAGHLADLPPRILMNIASFRGRHLPRQMGKALHHLKKHPASTRVKSELLTEILGGALAAAKSHRDTLASIQVHLISEEFLDEYDPKQGVFGASEDSCEGTNVKKTDTMDPHKQKKKTKTDAMECEGDDDSGDFRTRRSRRISTIRSRAL